MLASEDIVSGGGINAKHEYNSGARDQKWNAFHRIRCNHLDVWLQNSLFFKYDTLYG